MFIAVLFTIALKQNNPYVHQLINEKNKNGISIQEILFSNEKG